MNKDKKYQESVRKSDKSTVSPFRAGSNTDLVYRFLKENLNPYSISQLCSTLTLPYNAIYTALRRLVSKNYILKFKYDTFCEFAYPTSTLEIQKELWNVTKGLPHTKMHNIRLFHQFTKTNHAIYGVENTLGGRIGERVWSFGRDEFNRPIRRIVKWVLGFNKGKKVPPSIQITMSCTERPLSVPDDWLAFLTFLDGMLSLNILEAPEDWQLQKADFNTDYPLGPETDSIQCCEVKAFTDALCRIYDKKIDGLWYRRAEIAFSPDANFAPTLEDWKIQQNAGIRPDYAQSAIVGALNTISQESRATRVSQNRLEKVLTEQQKLMAEQQRQTNSILKDLASTIKDLKKGG